MLVVISVVVMQCGFIIAWLLTAFLSECVCICSVL